MAKINEALELLNNLIHSNVDDMIRMSKNALFNITSCLQDAQEKIEILQLESQLQQEELQQKSHHSEPISIQKIVKDSHQKKEDKDAVDSHSVPCTRADVHADAEFNLHFSSPSSDLGKSLSTTSTELVLDMTRMCPFIFQTTPSPSYFRVLDSCMTVHL